MNINTSSHALRFNACWCSFFKLEKTKNTACFQVHVCIHPQIFASYLGNILALFIFVGQSDHTIKSHMQPETHTIK